MAFEYTFFTTITIYKAYQQLIYKKLIEYNTMYKEYELLKYINLMPYKYVCRQLYIIYSYNYIKIYFKYTIK